MRIASAVLGVVLFVSTPSGAWAADELGLSRDGTQWSSTLPGDLFDANFRWVPGDQEFATFYVRNQSSTPALLDIDVLGTDIDSLLDTGDLEVAVRLDDGAWRATRQTGRQSLAASVPVAAGEQHRVTVSVLFDPTSANVSQVKGWALRFEIRLTQNGLVESEGVERDTDDSDDDDDGSDDGDSDRNGWLPGTGGAPWWVLPVGASFVGLGAALVKRHREEQVDV